MNKKEATYKLIQDLSKKERDMLLFQYSEIVQLKAIAKQVDNLKHSLIKQTHPENRMFFNKKSDNFKEIVNQLLQESWTAICKFDDRLQKYDYLKVADEYHLTFKELSDLYNEKIRKK